MDSLQFGPVGPHIFHYRRVDLAAIYGQLLHVDIMVQEPNPSLANPWSYADYIALVQQIGLSVLPVLRMRSHRP